MLNAVRTTSCSTNFQAGTWEEKNLTGWGKDRVKELMKELEEVSFPGGSARVTEVASCSGEVSSLDGHIIVQIVLFESISSDSRTSQRYAISRIHVKYALQL